MKSQRREEKRRRKKIRGESQKKDAGARKGRKVAKHGIFSMFRGSGGSKSRLAKAVGADPFGQMRGQKLHAIVAQSRCGSQKAKNTPRLEMSGALLAVVMWKKCTPLWREAHLEIKM